MYAAGSAGSPRRLGDSRLDPAGIYYDARIDHVRSQHGSIPLDGARFSFLGAVVQSFNFGYRHDDNPSHGFALGALIARGGLTRFQDAGQALAEIVDSSRARATS